MQDVISEGKLTYFAPIAQTPGFIALVAAFIQELKQAEINPEEFDTIVKTQKDHDIAEIYRAYQGFLRERSLVDKDGEGWLARASVERAERFEVDLLIVDGYDQFNPADANLSTWTGDRGPSPLCPDPPAAAGLSPLARADAKRWLPCCAFEVPRTVIAKSV